jgi:hypothetical protein
MSTKQIILNMPRLSESTRDFIKKIPAEDLNCMDISGAMHYVQELINKKTPVRAFTDPAAKKRNIDLGPAENPMKFNGFRSREPSTALLETPRKDASQKKYEEAIKTGDREKLEEISTKNIVDIANILKNLKMDPMVDFNAVTLPRRSILLDSRNRNPAFDDYSWNISNSNSLQLGEIDSRDTITQIVEVKCGPTRIPLVPGSNMLFYKKIRLGIEQFNAQGTVIAEHSDYRNKDYFHFEFDATQDGNYLELKPVDVWRPGKVINMLDKINLTFFGNAEKIQFLPDRYTCTYTASAPVVFTTPVPHFLNTGDLVYVGGPFYNKQGYLIMVLSATTFQIFAEAAVPGTIEVYCASRRIQIRMDFTLLEN